MRHSAPKEIFAYVAENTPKRLLSPSVVEDYVMSLLRTNNLNAATCIAHVALGARQDAQPVFSNQLWALLASAASSACHHSAALLVYHEIINPVAKYQAEIEDEHTDENLYSKNPEENEHIPFLLLPAAIEALAVVFAQHGNRAAIQGLHSYFQRFYSYMSHKDTYMVLQALVIESHAANGDLDNALDRFCDFAMKFRAHGKYKPEEEVKEALAYAVEVNCEKRLVEMHKHPRAAKIIYNKYTLPGHPFSAIFDGDLKVVDLPLFYELFYQNVRVLMEKNGSGYLDLLVFLMTKSHHVLGKFIIHSLCEHCKCFEALHVLNKMMANYKYAAKNPSYTLAPEFMAILGGMRRLFEACGGSVPESDRHLLNKVFELYLRYDRTNMVHGCYRAYVEAVLCDNKASGREVARELVRYNKLLRVRPTVRRVSYERAVSLGVSASLLRAEPA